MLLSKRKLDSIELLEVILLAGHSNAQLICDLGGKITFKIIKYVHLCF